MLLLMIDFICLLAAGAFGALTKDCLHDNKLRLPFIKGGEVVLGFIGSMVVGAFVGWAVDGSFLTAAMAGFMGSSVISSLVPKVDSDK